MLETLAIANYRSIRELIIPLEQLNLVTGPDGSGKSNLYRSLRLLAATARDGAVAALAGEGGFASTLWAGPETVSRSMLKGDVPVQGTVRSHPVSLRLGFAGAELSYCIDLGLPTPSMSRFGNDPEIKRENIWSGEVLRPLTLLVERRGPALRMRTEDGGWADGVTTVPSFESVMSHCIDPRHAPEVFLLREQMRGWRFYDDLATHRHAPARAPQVGTYSPVLDDSGANLAAAVQTILEIGDAEGLKECVEDAFPGSKLGISETGGWFELTMSQRGLLRPLRASELSDGTLRYVLLVAALLTPRPPSLMVLNEPETSLHMDLVPALARLIVRASKRSQVIVISHSEPLVRSIQNECACAPLMLSRDLGGTTLSNREDHQHRKWVWPKR